jgi:hypothetical protein
LIHEQVSFRAHYERFPATVKGAFVLKAAARDPHQVKILSARVADLAGHDSRSINLEPVTLDVAPRLDLFVPFEFSVTDLAPGWYGLECEVTVDGVGAVVHPGKRFPVAWPRATVRRGTIPVGKSIDAKGAKVRVEQVDCNGDSIKITYSAPEQVGLKLSADDATLTLIEEEFDKETGQGRVSAYPVFKTQDNLSIEVRGAAAPLVIGLR